MAFLPQQLIRSEIDLRVSSPYVSRTGLLIYSYEQQQKAKPASGMPSARRGQVQPDDASYLPRSCLFLVNLTRTHVPDGP